MAEPFGGDSRTQIKERTSALQQVARIRPAQVCHDVETLYPPAALIAPAGEFPVPGARR
jgi:hypothetical protein